MVKLAASVDMGPETRSSRCPRALRRHGLRRPWGGWLQPFLTLASFMLIWACGAKTGQRTGVMPLAVGHRDVDAILEAKVDELFEAVTDQTPGCAIGVAQAGQLVFAKGYGMADLEHGIPITPKTRFRIASVSKHFTAMAVLLLEEQGLVSLKEDIRTYMPELPEYEHIVTIRDLLLHSSGLPDNPDISLKWADAPDYFLQWAKTDDWFEEGLNYDFVPQRKYLEMLRSIDCLKFQPGTKYEYNNAGYVFLSVIVQRVSGKTLRQFAEEHMFGPLGMSETFFNDRALEIVPGRADGYHLTPNGTYLKYMSDWNAVGDGGLFTTVEDFARWDRNFYHNELGHADPTLIDKLTEPNHELVYPKWIVERNALSAMGILVKDSEFGVLEWSNGGWVTFTASARRLRSRQLSVFVFCNSRENIAPRLAARILKLWVDSPNE